MPSRYDRPGPENSLGTVTGSGGNGFVHVLPPWCWLLGVRGVVYALEGGFVKFFI